MERILLADNSVLRELTIGGVLDQLFALPFEFTVPDLLFHRELRGDSGVNLVALGLQIAELTSEEVKRATIVRRQNGDLSVPDAFAFSLAEARGWPMMTGTGSLHRYALQQRLDVRNVLWVFDQLQSGNCLKPCELHASLSALAAHPRCGLPTPDVRKRLDQYE